MTELERIRRVYDAIEEPTDKTISTAREVLLREIGSVESCPSRSRRRRAFVGIAAADPGVRSFSSRRRSAHRRSPPCALIESAPARPDVQAPVWSPGGGQIAFFNKREGGQGGLFVVSADGSGQRRAVTRDGGHSCLVFLTGGRSPSKAGRPQRRLCR